MRQGEGLRENSPVPCPGLIDRMAFDPQANAVCFIRRDGKPVLLEDLDVIAYAVEDQRARVGIVVAEVIKFLDTHEGPVVLRRLRIVEVAVELPV